MTRLKIWLFAPPTLPAAPPWWSVFAFGAVWNAVTGVGWACGVCAVGAVLLFAGGRVIR